MHKRIPIGWYMHILIYENEIKAYMVIESKIAGALLFYSRDRAQQLYCSKNGSKRDREWVPETAMWHPMRHTTDTPIL